MSDHLIPPAAAATAGIVMPSAFARLEVHRQLEFHRQLDGRVSGFSPYQDPGDVDRCRR